MNITIEMVTFGLLVLGAVSGVWWRVEGKIKDSALDAMTVALKAEARATANSATIAEHKLHVAENYMTKQGLREVRDEIITAVVGIKQDFQHLNERLDLLHDGPPKRSRPQV